MRNDNHNFKNANAKRGNTSDSPLDQDSRAGCRNRPAAAESFGLAMVKESSKASPTPEDANVRGVEPVGSRGWVLAIGDSLMGLAIPWIQKSSVWLVIAVAALGFSRLSFHAAVPRGELGFEYRPQRTGVVRFEAVRLWFPERFIELAKSHSDRPVFRDHRELKRFLERQNQVDLWYALTVRAFTCDGGPADVSYIRRPYHDVGYPVQEFSLILAIAAGKPPSDSALNLASLKVEVIPEAMLWNREARELMEELLHARRRFPDPRSGRGPN